MWFNDLFESTVARVQKPISYLVRILVVFSIIYTIYYHSWRILFINILLLIIILIPTIMKRQNIEIPSEIELLLFLFVIVSFFLGDYRGIIIQIFFGLALGFVGFVILLVLTKNSKIKMNLLLMYLSTICLSLSLGSLSEMLKFGLKYYLDYPSTIADYHYAIISLFFVFVGSILSSSITLIYFSGKNIPLMYGFVRLFKKKNPNLFVERTDSPDEILNLIKKGENDKVEFKSTLRTNLFINQIDKNIEHSVLKTITSFMNSEGGVLLIGVGDDGTIVGIEKDCFQNNDKFNLHFTNLIKEHIGNENLPYLHFEMILIEGKYILKADCLKSDSPIFLKFHKSEEFFIRVHAATVQIEGSKLVEYIKNNFGK